MNEKKILYSYAKKDEEMVIEFKDPKKIIHLGWTIEEIVFRENEFFVENILIKSKKGSAVNCEPRKKYNIPTPNGTVNIEFQKWLHGGSPTPKGFYEGRDEIQAKISFS